MHRIRQRFEQPKLADPEAVVIDQLRRLELGSRVKPGQTVALTVGSRGIRNIHNIARGVVTHLKSLGLRPYIVPAMGTHGGATAEGQREVIEGYGVTENYVGCEIRSSMDTVIVEKTKQGIPVHFDRNAYEADHVIVMGRVKPHTGFVGEIESGLHKMMLIGLGKRNGAEVYHKAIKDFSFMEIIRAVADVVIARCRVLAGVAIVENALDETALIEAVRPEDFFEREQVLLRQAQDWLPKLPLTELDLVIVDRIGKEISGTGMDTNIVGRKFNDHAGTEKDLCRVRRIYVRGISEGTHGNATGIGIAEFTNRRTVDAIDWHATYVNCVTAGHPTAAMIPVIYENDREAITAALGTLGLVEPPNAKVIRLLDTLHMEELEVSSACLPNIEDRRDIDIVTGPREFQFDAGGNLGAF
jgi:hypothetical protein